MRLRQSPMLPAAALLAIAFTFVLISPPAEARRGEPPLSYSAAVTDVGVVDVLAIDRPDVEALQREDAEREATGGGPYRYAQSIPVNVSPATHGTWETLEDGSRLWRLRILADQSTDLNLGFTRFWLPPGASLHVWSEDEDYYEGPYTFFDNEDHGELWVPVVPGERAVAELLVPAAVKFEPELELTHVGYGYRDLFKRAAQGEEPFQGACNNDVICPEGDPWRAEIASVAAYSLGGGILCTGQMVIDEPRTFRNFFLTANHCGVNSGNAASLTTYWNFESPNCGDLCCGSLGQNQTGAFWRAGRSDVDFTLVELDDDPNPAFGVYWAGWDHSGVTPQGSVGIHHPSGDEKAISFNDDPLTTINSCIGSGSSTHWRVNDWEDGTTEPGSSGSGLWDPGTHSLVGFLSGGIASCSVIGYDCYGKFAVAWDGGAATSRLRDWLDPNGTGTTPVAGSYPSGAGTLLYASHTGIDDCSTNPANVNGIWEPGESVQVIVELRAVGGNLTGISGTLTTTTPGVSIVDGTATWPDISTGGTATTDPPHFRVELDASIVCGTEIALQLAVTANEGGPFNLNFADEVGQSVLPQDLPLGIPDNNPTGATSSLEIPADVTLTDVDVRVKINHTWVGDLRIRLRSPAGSQILLLDRPGVPASTFGCQDDNMNITFDDASAFDPESWCAGTNPWYEGVAKPLQALSVFNGQSSQGTWTLTVSDHAGQDTGTLVEWELITTPPIEGTCDVCMPSTAVRDPADAPATLGLALWQNKPNPFNPHTTISMHLDRDGLAKLEIFDVAGRLVRTLIDGPLVAGEHRVTWNGTDALDRPVAAGVYFYRLTAGQETRLRRMHLVR